MPVLLSLGCDSIKGPNQSYLAPAVEGRLVDATSGEPLPDGWVKRYLGKPSKPDPLAEKGAQRLMTVPTVTSDENGQFQIAPEKGGYLLMTPAPVYNITLVARHQGYETLTTNIDLLKIKPVKTNKVLTVFVGDLPLKSKSD